jgi:hypothetical protein
MGTPGVKMNHWDLDQKLQMQQRAWALLRGGFRQDEVVSNLEVEFPWLDDIEKEDIPLLVRRVWHEIRKQLH